MAESPHWVRITDAFVLREKRLMYAWLESFDPDFRTVSQGGPVDVRIGAEVVRMRHVGAGNIEGRLVLMLRLRDPGYKTVEDVRAKMGDMSDVFVARVPEARD